MAPLLVNVVVVLAAPCSDISLAIPVRLMMPLARLVQSRCDRRVAPWAPAMATVPAVVMVEESVPKMLPPVHIRLLKTKLSEPVSVPPVRVAVPVLVLVAPVSKVVVPLPRLTGTSILTAAPLLNVFVPEAKAKAPTLTLDPLLNVFVPPFICSVPAPATLPVLVNPFALRKVAPEAMLRLPAWVNAENWSNVLAMIFSVPPDALLKGTSLYVLAAGLKLKVAVLLMSGLPPRCWIVSVASQLKVPALFRVLLLNQKIPEFQLNVP